MKANNLPASLALSPAAETDWRNLIAALLDMADEGIRPPCASDPEAFTSDSPEDRRYAARRCADCPARVPCADYGEHEEHHVWGGIDRAPRSRPRADDKAVSD